MLNDLHFRHHWKLMKILSLGWYLNNFASRFFLLVTWWHETSFSRSTTFFFFLTTDSEIGVKKVGGEAPGRQSPWCHRFQHSLRRNRCFSPYSTQSTDPILCVSKWRNETVTSNSSSSWPHQPPQERLLFASAKHQVFCFFLGGGGAWRGLLLKQVIYMSLHLIRQLCDEGLWERERRWDLLSGTVRHHISHNGTQSQ